MGSESQHNEKVNLTQDKFVDCAFRMIDEQGVQSFSMRKLGKEMGISAMTAYSYFPSQDDLLLAVMKRYISLMDISRIPGERWDDTMKRSLKSTHQVYLDHPHFSSISLSPQMLDEAYAEYSQKSIGLYLEQGMPEELLSRIWPIINAVLAAYEDHMRPTHDAVEALSAVKHSDEEDAGNENTQDLPAWRRIVNSAYTEESFQNGIEVLIGAIRGMAAPDPCEWHTPR